MRVSCARERPVNSSRPSAKGADQGREGWAALRRGVGIEIREGKGRVLSSWNMPRGYASKKNGKKGVRARGFIIQMNDVLRKGSSRNEWSPWLTTKKVECGSSWQ